MSFFLARWGELRVATTFAQAKAVVDADAPEILLVDPVVDDGDGLELLAYARAKVPWAQALLISTTDSAHLMGSYIAAGANDVVTRPFDIGTLETRIVRLKEALPARRLEVERLMQLEARVRHVDAISMLGTLAATVAHEIAGPLSAILTNAELIDAMLKQQRMTDGDRLNAQQATQDVAVAARAIQEFIVRIRGQARAGEGSFVCDTIAPVLETSKLFLKQKVLFSGARVQWPEVGELPRLDYLPTRLTQALTNAVANAVEATGQGGHVRVRCEAGPETVTILVSDDGPGLSGEALKRAVQPFHTTKAGGTGLGMSVIGDVVREHGGELMFEAGEGGRGLCLKMVLPRSRTGLPPSSK
jgi:signal transduction histidine kinase